MNGTCLCECVCRHSSNGRIGPRWLQCVHLGVYVNWDQENIHIGKECYKLECELLNTGGTIQGCRTMQRLDRLQFFCERGRGIHYWNLTPIATAET
jgi:hypothetical protein